MMIMMTSVMMVYDTAADDKNDTVNDNGVDDEGDDYDGDEDFKYTMIMIIIIMRVIMMMIMIMMMMMMMKMKTQMFIAAVQSSFVPLFYIQLWLKTCMYRTSFYMTMQVLYPICKRCRL